ncbi:MAG TPA: 5'-nucleotidase C-terminal domain-containing protein [Gemmatimonadales bacterium]
MPLWFPLATVLNLHAPPVPRPPSLQSDTVQLIVVATTDVHGWMRGWDYVRDAAAPGGLARAATILETLRARHADRVVLLDVGDLLQGNPFAHYFATEDRRRPHPVVDALNALGYDAATPGNHEFNYGLEFLARATGDATFSYVSANITRGTGDSLLFAPSVVIPRGGVRVGVTGFTTPGVMVWDRASVLGKARVRRVEETAPEALRRLAAANVDLKIALIHAGLGGASTYDTTGTGAENAAAVLAATDPKPDLVIVGHSHREIRDTVINGVHFVQPKNWAQSVSVVYVTLVRGAGGAGPGRYRVAAIRADLIPLATVPEQPRITRRFEEAHERVRAWAATPLGVAGPGFDGRGGRVRDTPLTDFVNEVQRRRTGADLSATAMFDAGTGLKAGEILYRDVAGIYPYENTLRAVRISGLQLKAFLEHSSRYFHTFVPGQPVVDDRVPGYNFDIVSGLRYTIDLSQPVGQRVRMSWQGRAVQSADSFTLALNSYRQEGGGGYAMLQGAPVVYDRGENLRDLLVAEIRRVGTLRAADYYAVNWSLLPAAARDAALAAFAPRDTTPVSDADSTLLRVLAIADFHGALLPRTWEWSGGRPVGGAAALKAWLDSLARACGCASVRLDAGDQMQGTAISALRHGRPALDVLNMFGLDAAAVGNHEFDWSLDTLRARAGSARYPFLAANITDITGTTRPAWIEPWVLIERGGQKIGVIGIANAGTATSTAPWNVRGLRFGQPAAAVKRVLPQVRAAGAQVVIVVAHEGAICEAGACSGEAVTMARQLDSGSVDLVVAGHTHRAVRTVVNGIPIVQAGSSGGAVGVVDFVRVGRRREVRVQLVTPYTDGVRPNAEVEAIVARHRRAVDSLTGRVVTRLRFALPRDGSEYALGRLIADAFRNVAKADLGLINNSGIRDALPGGSVTYGQLFQVLPFQNRVLRVQVRGSTVLEALEHALRGDTPVAHVAGVEVWYDPSRPAGRRVSRTRLGDGREIDAGGIYTLAVPDFLAAGGSGFSMLVGQPAEETGLPDIDAVVRYLSVLREPVAAPAEPRLHRGGS